MTDATATERNAHRWYLRPVLFVSDVQAALRFYVDKLGFEKQWHEGDGKGTVCQVHRGGCAIILCENPERHGKARLYIELTRDGIDELRRAIEARSVPAQQMWWGSDVIRVADPDGNEMFFPLAGDAGQAS